MLRAAAAVAADLAAGTAPPSIGIRGQVPRGARPATAASGRWTSSSAGSGGAGPSSRCPKVTDVEQVAAFLPVLDALQDAHRVTLDLELQIETPQAVLGPDGTATLARMVHVAGPRLIGLHYGTYDYSAALGIAAAHQSSDHPAADFAKQLMQVAVAGTGAHAVDGSTNVLPVGSREHVHAAWQLHAAAGAPGPGTRLLPGLGPAPGAARHPLRRRPTPSSGPRCRPPPGGWPPTSTAPPPACSTNRPPPGRSPRVVLRGLDCGAVDEAEILAAGGPDAALLAKLAGRRPGGS